MYDQILFPTDGGDNTDQSLAHAFELADTYDATLHVLSVVDTDAFAALDGIDSSTVRVEREDRIQELTRRAAERGIDAVTELREGKPSDQILAYRDAVDADLIVMGTQGRSGVDRMLVGSVTESVVRRSPVPVVTVRETVGAAVTTADAATEHAIDALEANGHDEVSLAESPHRTSGSWIVPLRSDSGTFHVHVDSADGEVRIAQLD